jgi:nucleoid-associated protein YgaU
LRQGVTLTVLQFVDADDLKLTGAGRNRARTQRQAGRTKASDKVPKTYTVKSGDTLAKIAAAIYHDQAKWRAIAALNGIRDPRNIKAGQHLRLP